LSARRSSPAMTRCTPNCIDPSRTP
jgi:hypothetical protein